MVNPVSPKPEPNTEANSAQSQTARPMLTEEQLHEIVELAIEGWGLDVAQAVYQRLKPYVKKGNPESDFVRGKVSSDG